MSIKKALNFIPESYKMYEKDDFCFVKIKGHKLKPPSKRITLHQKNIKILRAKIVRKDKKGDIEYAIARINAVKSFGQIRLHTNNVLYPGTYVLELEYSGELEQSQLGEKTLNLAQ